MKKYDSILFDLDGTLTNSAEGITKSAAMVLDHYGIPYASLQDLTVFIGPPLRDTFPKFGVPSDEVEEAVALFRKRYISVGKFENHPYEGMIPLLAKLKEEGYKLYVATSKPEVTAREILEHFHMTEYFEEIAGALMDGSRDEKEQVIAYLHDTCDVQGKALMVGDTDFDIIGASHCGLDSIGVSWGFGSTESMRKAGAAAIVSTMDELYDFVHVK